MKVYIAAPWLHKQDAIAAGQRLVSLGIEVTSNWFFHEGDPKDPTGVSISLAEIQYQAKEDIKDVLRADYVVVLNLAKSEGKAVETGIAIANNIPVISVGTRSNIFQSLGPEVASLDDAIAILQGVTHAV